jgi:hypothetical protein
VTGSIIVGFGIGLAAYSVGRLFSGAPSQARRSKSTDSAESIQPAVTLSEGAAIEPPAEAALVEDVSAPAAPISEEAPVLELQAEDETAEDESDADVAGVDTSSGAKSWYLIRTAKGYLRACRCRAATSTTVAGPFATRPAANKAKQRFASLTPQSPRA